jgi:hypothetical protein
VVDDEHRGDPRLRIPLLEEPVTPAVGRVAEVKEWHSHS